MTSRAISALALPFVAFGWTACLEPLGVAPSDSVSDPDDVPVESVSGPSESESSGPSEPANELPVADAGDDLIVVQGESVDLDGTHSYDPDGDNLNFHWSFIEKPQGSGSRVLGDSFAQASFLADRTGIYVIELEVSDGTHFAQDIVEIEATEPNQPPIGIPGATLNVEVGSSAQLDGTGSYDPDGSPLTYSWTLLTKPSGSGTGLENPESSRPRIRPDREGEYVVRLIVNDGTHDSQPANVRVVAYVQSSGGDSGCDCAEAEQLARSRWQTADAATGASLLLFPVLTLLGVSRRRESNE